MNPILLLHGFTGSSRSWDEVVSRLPADQPIFRPHLLGHGEAGDAARCFLALPGGFEGEVGRIAGWLRSRTAEPVHLVGYSLGARVALGLALRYPGQVGRLTLIGVHPGLPEAGQGGPPGAREERRALEERWIRVLREEGTDAFVQMFERLPLFASQRHLPPALLSRQRALRRGQDALGLALSLDQLGLSRMPCFARELPALRIPLTLVVGGGDERFLRMATQMKKEVEGARLEVVAQAGHNVVLEQPAEIADILRGRA